MRTMLKVLTIAGLAGLCGLGHSIAFAGEESLPLKKVPKRVLAAVMAKFPGAKAIEAAKEEEDGETKYEVVVMLKGKRIDVLVDDENEVEGYETEIEFDDLTVRVAKALSKAFPNAKHTKVEAVYEVEDGKDELEYYEIQVITADKKEAEAKFKPNGTPFIEEKAEKKDERDEKEEHGKVKSKGDEKHEKKADKHDKDEDGDEKEEHGKVKSKGDEKHEKKADKEEHEPKSKKS